MADNALDNLYFDYKLSGDAAFRPERVLDDGQHTYLIYPNDGRFRELPTLLMVGQRQDGAGQLPRRWVALYRRSPV